MLRKKSREKAATHDKKNNIKQLASNAEVAMAKNDHKTVQNIT